MAILSKKHQLKKSLSLFNIFTIATGATIASGFFLLPGLAFAEAGPAMVLSYIIAAIPVIPALYSKSELATAMPRAGGVYFFLDRSMGPMLGTIGGIGTWIALILKTSFALVGIGAYLSLFFPDITMLPISIAFAIIFGIINLLGAKKSGSFQSILVVGLLLLLGWFSVTGSFHLNVNNFSGFWDGNFSSIFSTAGLVYVSYVGLSKIASLSEEVKNPEKNIPKAMFLAFATALVIYVVGTIILIGVLSANELQNNLSPIASAAEIMAGKSGAVLMTIAAVFAFFSVANAGILSSSRYPLAMSRDHIFPAFFRSFTKGKVPINAILFTVVLVISVLLLFNPIKIAKLAGAFQLLLFALISLAVIVMRESKIESYDPGFKSPLYPWMQIFGIITPFWLIIEMGWLPTLFTIGLIVVSIGWYFYYARDKVLRNGAIYHLFARLGSRRFEGLDSDLRRFLKAKGVRDEDYFNHLVAEARFIDLHQKTSFEEITNRVSKEFSDITKYDSEILEKLFLDGTLIGATPVSNGAALPHVRLGDIDRSYLIVIRSGTGVKFEVDHFLGNRYVTQEPIFAFFFLLSPEGNPGKHLRILAQIASHVDSEMFLQKWKKAKNEQEIKELLLRDDRYLALELKKDKKTEGLINCEIKSIDLPESTLIAIIHRDNELVVPRGRTVLEENDRITIISNPRGIEELYQRYIEDF
ncbi:MAG: amino acid permease [Calditrichaeota bacterium]|nr:MAG: amino acid permease [Calditrichota bacterium]MBL1207610.1 amino acid permease [Calditrichota bacterium]NOG47443.1 amino acid permease [Calditrichota bacterium]